MSAARTPFHLRRPTKREAALAVARRAGYDSDTRAYAFALSNFAGIASTEAMRAAYAAGVQIRKAER